MFLSQQFKGLSPQWNQRTGRIGASAFASSLCQGRRPPRERLLPLALTEEEGVLLAPRAKAPLRHRPAHLHRGVHPVEAVLHCYRAAVSQYHRTAVVQHRHQGVLTGAGAPPNEALHSAPALLSAVAVRVGHRGLHPAAVVSHQCMGMALHPAPPRPLSGTGTGASHPNR